MQNEQQFLSDAYRNLDRDIYYKAHMLCGQVWAACRMNSWCLDIDGTVYQSFSDYPDELFRLFQEGKCLEYLNSQLSYRFPILLSDTLGLLWIAEFNPKEGKGNVLYVLGPVFESNSSQSIIETRLQELDLPITVRRKLKEILRTVPVLYGGTVFQYARMLHYTLTGEACEGTSFRYQRKEMEVELLDDSHPITYEKLRKDHLSLERVLLNESALMRMVREGKRTMNMPGFAGEGVNPADIVSGNTLQNGKYDAIVFNALCSRAASEGGVPDQTVRTVEILYSRQIHHCKTMTELRDVCSALFHDYIERVHRVRENPGFSEPVRRTMDMIDQSLTLPIKLEQLASELGYTKYYISRKFLAETGMRISDYINKQRVEYAKILLAETDASVQDISFSLQFNTRAYFSDVFRKITGETPSEYRERMHSE